MIIMSYTCLKVHAILITRRTNVMPQEALKRLKKGAQSSVESSLSLASTTALAARIYSTVLYPVLLSLWVAEFLSKETDSNLSVFMILVAIVCTLLQIIFFIQISFTENARSHSLEDLEVIEQQYLKIGENYNSVRDSLLSTDRLKLYQQNCLHFTSLTVENSIRELKEFEDVLLTGSESDKSALLKDAPDFDAALTEIKSRAERQLIWPLVSLRDDLFGYESDSLYNIALYQHKKSQDLLVCKARFCDDRINRRDRPWKPGMGHVGLAFVQGEVKFCNDVESSSELKTEKVDGKIIYRSFVSVPITRIGHSEVPYGVLVLTSRHANQFDIDKDQVFLIVLSKLIGLYYTVLESLVVKLNQMSIPTVPESFETLAEGFDEPKH